MKTLLIAIMLFQLPDFSIQPLDNPCGIMYPRGGDGDWGIGVYLIPDSTQFNIYEDSTAARIGYLEKGNHFFQLFNRTGERQNITFGDIEWIAHTSNLLLKVKKCKSEKHFKVLWNTFENGVCIKKNELENIGAKFYSYKDLLFQVNIPKKMKEYISWAKIGVNFKKDCLNLRESPSINSSIIVCVPGNDWKSNEHSHFKILKTLGDWAMVEVTTYIYDPESDESGEGCTFLEKNKRIGWVKAIDKTGFPNIWYSVTSY